VSLSCLINMSFILKIDCNVLLQIDRLDNDYYKTKIQNHEPCSYLIGRYTLHCKTFCFNKYILVNSSFPDSLTYLLSCRNNTRGLECQTKHVTIKLFISLYVKHYHMYSHEAFLQPLNFFGML